VVVAMLLVTRRSKFKTFEVARSHRGFQIEKKKKPLTGLLKKILMMYPSHPFRGTGGWPYF